jgi:hypothetical protein
MDLYCYIKDILTMTYNFIRFSYSTVTKANLRLFETLWILVLINSTIFIHYLNKSIFIKIWSSYQMIVLYVALEIMNNSHEHHTF